VRSPVKGVPWRGFLSLDSIAPNVAKETPVAKKPTPSPAQTEPITPSVPSADTQALITATTEKMQSAIISAGIDPVTTVGMQEVKVIRAVFDKHMADLAEIIPACAAVDPSDAATAKTLALKVKRIRTAAEKNRLELNKDSRSRIAAVDGTNRVLLHVLSPVEAHLNKIVDDAAAAERKVAEDSARFREAEIKQYASTEGYDFLAMSEDMYQRLLLRVREEKDSSDRAELARRIEREAVDKALKEAARIADEAAEKARQERQAAEAEAAKLREELAAKQRAEDQAKRAAEEKARKDAEEKARKDRLESLRILLLQDRLNEIRDMTSHTVTASSGETLYRMGARLDEFAGMQWDEMDMEAEGRIDMARAWLAGAKAKAADLHKAEVERIAAEEKALALSKASDSVLLAALLSGLDDFVKKTASVRGDLKLSENQHLVASLMSGIETHREMIFGRAACGASAVQDS
jgi:hypothetical protein